MLMAQAVKKYTQSRMFHQSERVKRRHAGALTFERDFDWHYCCLSTTNIAHLV